MVPWVKQAVGEVLMMVAWVTPYQLHWLTTLTSECCEPSWHGACTLLVALLSHSRPCLIDRCCTD